jgi:hypothetical protein
VTKSTPMLKLPLAMEMALVAGARDLQPVRGLTHDFYKYPAVLAHHLHAPPSRRSLSPVTSYWIIMLGEGQH